LGGLCDSSAVVPLNDGQRAIKTNNESNHALHSLHAGLKLYQVTDFHTTLTYIYNIAYFGLIVNVYIVNKVSSDYLKVISGQNLNLSTK